MAEARVFTIGHSSMKIEEFLSCLESSGVRMIADVRTNPVSGRFPQFERYALAAKLETRGISYRWFRELGGEKATHLDKEKNDGITNDKMKNYASYLNEENVRRSINAISGLAVSTNVAIMASEEDPFCCHRSILADELVIRDFDVVHIYYRKPALRHQLNPMRRIVDAKVFYKNIQMELLE